MKWVPEQKKYSAINHFLLHFVCQNEVKIEIIKLKLMKYQGIGTKLQGDENESLISIRVERFFLVKKLDNFFAIDNFLKILIRKNKKMQTYYQGI